jgi:MFS family permease
VQKQTGFRQMLPAARLPVRPLLLLVFARSFVVTSLGVYMPTLLKSQGATMWAASGALTLYQMAGVVGALAGGTVSDRLGRKPVLFAVTLLSPFLMLAFLNTQGWLWVLVLLVTGLLSLSGQPILLALVQDYLPQHRSVANGFFMALSFIGLSVTSLLIGMLADRLGLHQAFFWSAILGFGALPAVFWLPVKKKASS